MRRGKVTSSRGAGDMLLQGNDVDEHTLFWCHFMQFETLILLKMQPQLLSNSNVSTSKNVYFPLVIKSFSVEHQIAVYTLTDGIKVNHYFSVIIQMGNVLCMLLPNDC